MYGHKPLEFPEYLSWYNNNSRLRTTHLDTLSFISNLTSRNTGTRNLQKSFFFRSHTLWNSLPFVVRSCFGRTNFKEKLNLHFWELVMSEASESDDEWSFMSSDDGG